MAYQILELTQATLSHPRMYLGTTVRFEGERFQVINFILGGLSNGITHVELAGVGKQFIVPVDHLPYE